MMWAGVTSELTIRLYFFDVTVTGESYLELLSHWLSPELNNASLLNNVIFQQDGAPVSDVHAFLNSQFLLCIG
jgi:hypothetical protein